MIVRVIYADGTMEDHELQNGVHFADVNGEQEVPAQSRRSSSPASRFAIVAVKPKRKDMIASIELVKGSDQTAPIVLAATVEAFE